MKKPFFSRNRKGFTLIELIVVIGILGTLAGISYPVYMSVQESAKTSSAKKACLDIVEGVTRFSTDNNGFLPYDPAEAEPDDNNQIYLETTAGKDARLIQILTNREDDDDERINKQRSIYLRSDEQETPIDGLFVDSADGIHFYDPWGNPYQVVLCQEEEGCRDPFKPKKRATGKSCLVYSLGPDGEGRAATPTGKKNGKAADAGDSEALEDNVYSWKKSK